MYVAQVDDVEKKILSGIFADVAQLLGTDLRDPSDFVSELEDSLDSYLAEPPTHVGEPLDPALARLLPRAYDDDEDAAEFRRLTESDLRLAKVNRLRQWFQALTGPSMKIYVPVEEAGDWVAALTDVRLVLATRLGVESAEDAEDIYSRTEPEGQEDQDYSDFALGQVYSALTWLQDSLLEVMMSAR